MAHKIEELPIYPKVVEFCSAVNALLEKPGSLAELLTRLKHAYFKKYITADELRERLEAGDELGKMLGGFIKYLRRCDWTERGGHNP